MPTLSRSIEVHRLTISGIPERTHYGPFLRSVFDESGNLSDRVYDFGSKSHALHSLRIVNGRFRLRFLSFTSGFRPDILDTDQFVIQPNPLGPSQTGVEWTHVLGGRLANRYVLFVEKVRSGIAPRAIEAYLQRFIDDNYELDANEDNDEPAVISFGI